MALAPNQRLISADDHMDIYVLPKDLWESRLPKKFREVGPRVVDTFRKSKYSLGSASNTRHIDETRPHDLPQCRENSSCSNTKSD